ncbi:MAG: transcription termination/antitermination protein NusA [Chloroflexi bacterium]|jgi:N utilization substance protein A|nr:transcription termination/antitermination protein NusA [Chloroflexota bacterium]
MKNEFTLAFNEVLEDKQLPKEVIMEALEAAMVSAYRRAVNASNAQHVEAKIDPESGRVVIYAEKEVVETVQDPRTEVSLREAQKVDPEAEIGSMVVVETTPRNFGRVAAQTARQVIQQRIREAERDAQFNHYSKQLGEIVSGVVQAVNSQGVTLGLDMKAEGIMPRNQQIQGERFRVHDRVRALLLEVKITTRGPQIILSRAHRNFLRRLLENEVPEIYHGMVEIRSIAREPGQRSKVAVAALQPGVDPVGACVGIRGVRIQAIVRELNDEKIDVIEWSPDPAVYIAKALSPARVSGVYLNEHGKGIKTATVVVPEDQLSLAIGRDGQNARLAAKLTGWRIDIKSLPEAATDALYRVQNDPSYAAIAEEEAELLPQLEAILAKKAEGRPVTPEEYQVMTHFVDRVERGLLSQRQAEKQAEQERQRIAQANVPAAAFDIPLEEFEVSDRVYAVISEAGLQSVGELMVQMRTDPDSILKLSGMGPKGMKELEEALDRLEQTLREQEAQPAEEAPAEVETAAEPAAEAVAETAPVEEEAVEETTEPVEVTEEAPEEVIEASAEPVDEEAAGPAAAAETETMEEQADLLDEIFSLPPEAIGFDEFIDEEEEETDTRKPKKKGKKKKKYVEMEYDPDQDIMVVKKKRKRGDDWDESWDL